jgi:hypothetical protein
VGERVRLFEYDDRAVASFDPNNAIVFDAGAWRPANLYIARGVLMNGTELSKEEFGAQFPSAAASLSRIDFQLPTAKPS